MLNKLKDNRHLIQVFTYLILITIFLVEDNINLGGHIMYSKLDDMIPFVPAFIVPYCSWFLFIAFTGITFFLKSKIDLEKTFLSINICMAIGLLTYFIYPSCLTIRPKTYDKDIFSQIVKLLQEGDSPSSVCPSLHVAVSISLCTGILNSIYFKNKNIIKFFTVILTFFICISTLFIKQHSVIDVAFGLLLGFASYIFVYKIYFSKKSFKQHTEKNNYEHTYEDNVASK